MKKNYSKMIKIQPRVNACCGGKKGSRSSLTIILPYCKAA